MVVKQHSIFSLLMDLSVAYFTQLSLAARPIYTSNTLLKTTKYLQLFIELDLYLR